MSNTAWAEGSIRPTPQGVRIDLRLYVYADGHGNIFGSEDTTNGALLNNVEEAVSVFRELWLRLQGSRQAE